MTKKMTKKDKIEKSIKDLTETINTVDIGYPFFGVPQALKRVRRRLRELLKEKT
jgi:hypothetical protein